MRPTFVILFKNFNLRVAMKLEVDDLILSLCGVSPIYTHPVYKLLCTSGDLVPTLRLVIRMDPIRFSHVPYMEIRPTEDPKVREHSLD